MPREQKSLENQIEWLADEILILKESLIGLTGRMEALERGGVLPESATSARSHEQISPINSANLPEEPGAEESWSKLSQEVLLPRIAAVSFMLVIALLLRTATDNGMVAQVAGSIVGFTYATGLIGVGCFMYRKENRLAPVFPACGVLLLFSIIYETHSYFLADSVQYAYILLVVVEISIAFIAVRCRAAVLLYIAVFGSTVVAVALDYANMDFTMVACVVIVNAVVGHLAARYQITTKLRWYSLLFALIVWTLWTYKLNFIMGNTPDLAGEMGLPYFLPLLFGLWAFYIYTSLWKTLTKANEFGVFHTFLPAVVSGCTFFAANGVLKPWVGQQRLIGFATVLVSAAFMALVAWLAKRQENDIPGGKEFVTAATVLLIQGLAVSVPPLWALPVWVAAAGALTIRSSQWHSGGIRVISYLFQMFILAFAIKNGVFTVGSTAWLSGALTAALLSAMTLWLFSWCRTHQPEFKSTFFGLFDKKDYSAVVLLIIGLFEAYVAARFLVGRFTVGLSDPENAFYCAQSVVLNSGIVILLITGLRLRNKEILVVAGFVVLVAAFKVFLFDLLRTDGVPLVLSVFSFGVVAATSSVVMRKWSVVRKNIEVS
nr:DUF2339 domain-containing protein [Desulfobulbaceae bacterium]